jgi:hypothetical protein
MILSKEQIAGAVQLAIEKNGGKMAEDLSYGLGNVPLATLQLQELALHGIECGSILQSSQTLGSTVFKTVEDFTRGDKLCCGLCIVATTCEVVAIVASWRKFPGRYRVYVVAKDTSLAVIKFRDLCRNSVGNLIPC